MDIRDRAVLLRPDRKEVLMTFTKTLHQQGKLTRIHPERKIKHNPDPLHPDEIEMCLTCEKKTCRGCENKFREMRKTT